MPKGKYDWWDPLPISDSGLPNEILVTIPGEVGDIEESSGFDLDAIGAEFDIQRHPSESDAEFRLRVIVGYARYSRYIKK